MKLYKTTAKMADGSASVRWAGSQAEAATNRKVFNQSGVKREYISTEEVDVPTNKAGLLEWLNDLGA